MLKYIVLIIIKPQVKISSWSKDGHIAHFWPPYISSKLKPVHEAQYQLSRRIYYIITINDHPWDKAYMQIWFYWPLPFVQIL